jgi:REP element-mobilizing transposase RayT
MSRKSEKLPMDQKIKKTPPRLEQIFQQYDPPLYFVTFNTRHRKPLLARQEIFDAFVAYARKNEMDGRAVGRFVIMPDHIHLFVRIGSNSKLSDFIRLLKQALTKELRQLGEAGDVWQPGFFDRLLRHSESYSEQWNYIRENPVRAGLVEHPEDWIWQGEVVRIEM